MAGTYSELVYQLIFSTKSREPLISLQLREKLHAYIGGIIRDQGGRLLEIGGMQDHVHLLVRIKADLSVSESVRLVKSNSSKWVNEQPDRGPHGSRSRVEGDKRTETSEIEHEPRHCQKQLDGGDYVSGVEVSESAVSVPRRESPTTALRIAVPVSVAPISKVLSGGT